MDLYAITNQQILEKISRHCPSALALYIQCLNRCDKNGRVFFNKKIVEQEMSDSWTKVKNSIKKLALEDLLEWHPFDGGITVLLVLEEEDEN